MEILRLQWDTRNEEHVTRRATIAEVEEAIFDAVPVYRRGREGTHLALSQTAAGRRLLIVLRYRGKGMARVITVREMTDAEERLWDRERRGRR